MSSGGRDACPLFSAFGSYVEVAGKFAVPEPRMFIGGEDQHELSQRRVDFLFLEVGKRKAHSLVRSEEEGIHRRRRGADLSAEAYDAEARREYGEKAFHGYLRISLQKRIANRTQGE